MKRPFRRPPKLGFSASLLRAFGGTISWLYRMAFGGFEEPLYRMNRRGFIREIERCFSYVMSEHEGRIVPREGEELPRALDYVAVTIEFKEIRLRLIRGRGELNSAVASFSAPYSWEDLSLVSGRLSRSEPADLPSRPDQLLQLALFLQGRFDQIVKAVTAAE